MQFISVSFLAFLPIVVLINLIIPRKFRYIWLLITSIVFYASIDVPSTIILLVSIVTTYLAGLWIGKVSDGRSKPVLAICIIANLGILFTCKYLNVVIRDFMELSGKGDSYTPLNIIAPVGLSFYMLKAIGYMIDVYRKDIPAEKNPVKYALFVSFFPQVISGPIERAKSMLQQFTYPLSVDYYRLKDGLYQMLWGYFLKLIVADRLAIFVNSVYGRIESRAGVTALIATFFYTMEIYADFAGYSCIAIGASRVLGIDVMKNFDAPYLSKSIAEFWRRWHISLSSWFRDYVYIPLGGNRKGTVRKYINILIVFTVSGIWHGAGLNFLLWGLLHGIYQVIGFLMMPVRDFFVKTFNIQRRSLSHRIFKIAFTFLLVNYAWVFFRCGTVSEAWNIIMATFKFTPWTLVDGSLYTMGLSRPSFAIAVFGIILMIVVDVFNYNDVIIRERILRQGLWLRWLIAISAILFIVICGIWGPGYDLTNFIYQQF